MKTSRSIPLPYKHGKHHFLRHSIVFSSHDLLKTMKFTLQHQQESPVHSLYTSCWLPWILSPAWPILSEGKRNKSTSQTLWQDSLTDSLFKTLIGRRILMLEMVRSKACWEQGCWSNDWGSGRICCFHAFCTGSQRGITSQRGRVKAQPFVLKSQERVEPSVPTFSGSGRQQYFLLSISDLNFHMVVTELSSKLPELGNLQ